MFLVHACSEHALCAFGAYVQHTMYRWLIVFIKPQCPITFILGPDGYLRVRGMSDDARLGRMEWLAT